MAASKLTFNEEYANRSISSAPVSESFISSLPLGAHSFFISNARNAVVETIGSTQRKNIIANPLRPQKLKRIPVTLLADDVQTTETLIAKLTTLGLTVFYDPYLIGTQINPDIDPLIAAYLTILSAYFTASSLDKSGIVLAFKQYGYQLEFCIKTEEELNVKFEANWKRFSRYTNIQDFSASIHAIIVIGLSIMPLMVKHLTSPALDTWFDDRWRAIASIVKYGISMNGYAKPVMANCNAIHTLLSTMHRARSLVFQLMRGFAHQGHTKYSAVFEAIIIRTMRCAEFIPMYMIHYHIMQKNKDILSLVELCGSEKMNLSRAYEFLLSIPEEDRPFVKILYDPKYTGVLNQSNFKSLYTAVRAIASLETRSIDQIETAGKEESSPLFKKYLNM